MPSGHHKHYMSAILYNVFCKELIGYSFLFPALKYGFIIVISFRKG